MTSKVARALKLSANGMTVQVMGPIKWGSDEAQRRILGRDHPAAKWRNGRRQRAFDGPSTPTTRVAGGRPRHRSRPAPARPCTGDGDGDDHAQERDHRQVSLADRRGARRQQPPGERPRAMRRSPWARRPSSASTARGYLRRPRELRDRPGRRRPARRLRRLRRPADLVGPRRRRAAPRGRRPRQMDPRRGRLARRQDASPASPTTWSAGSGTPRPARSATSCAGTQAKTPHHFPSMLFACAFSPDGQYLATGDKVGHIVVWDVATGEPVATLEAPVMYTWDPVQRRHSIGGIRSLAFSPDGNLLAVGGMGKVGNIDHLEGPARVEVFDWRKGEAHPRVPRRQLQGPRRTPVFLPDGDWLLAVGGANDGFLMIFDLKAKAVASGEDRFPRPQAGEGRGPDLLPGGTWETGGLRDQGLRGSSHCSPPLARCLTSRREMVRPPRRLYFAERSEIRPCRERTTRNGAAVCASPPSFRPGGRSPTVRCRRGEPRSRESGRGAVEGTIVIAWTPWQCFLAGLVASLLVGATLGLLLWRHLAALRERDPDYFTRLMEEVQSKKARRI